MARKNLITISTAGKEALPEEENTVSLKDSRPIAGFSPLARANAPIGGISKTLGNITQKVERAQDLEKQLAEGLTIVELDPALIEASFVSDRLAIEKQDLDLLVEQIRDHGQQVPIMVRPHPQKPGNYQVAYGHRRLAAIRQLGIKVRAVVRDLTDDQLVVSQGQENNARTNLSYIERALFASRLEDRSFSRDVIMSALGVDKAALSKMISVVRQIPTPLIEAVGPAPEIGRRRWMELSQLLDHADIDELLLLLRDPAQTAMDSNQRFQFLIDTINHKKSAPKLAIASKDWSAADNRVRINLKNNGKTATITIGAADGLSFAEFITGQLDVLHAAFQEVQKKETGE